MGEQILLGMAWQWGFKKMLEVKSPITKKSDIIFGYLNWIFLIISICTLLLLIYFSEFFFRGEFRVDFLKYYIANLVSIFLLAMAFKYKGKMRESIILIIVSTIIGVLLFEIALTKPLEKRISKVIESQKVLHRYRNNIEITAFRRKYEDRLDHLRGGQNVKDETSKPTDLLFTTTTKFSPQNIENILIQGDSWAEAARMSEEYLSEFSKKKNWGLILGGISSFSPSPMSLQLDILRRDFSIRPSVVIAIIDQTDIGDELFRYKEHYINNNGELQALNKEGHNERENNIIFDLENNLLSKNLKVYKLIKHLFLQYLNSEFSIRGSDILSPLENGMNLDQSALFRSRLKTYVQTVFEDPATNKLVIVSHPHRNHLIPNGNDKKYIGDVSNLIDTFLTKHKNLGNMNHIKFRPKRTVLDNDELDSIFKAGDRFSHLTDDYYHEYYYKKLLDDLETLLKEEN